MLIDAFSPDSVRRNGGPEDPVGSGATEGNVHGADALEGSGTSGAGVLVAAGASGAVQQERADGRCDPAGGETGRNCLQGSRSKVIAGGCRVWKQGCKKVRALLPLLWGTTLATACSGLHRSAEIQS